VDQHLVLSSDPVRVAGRDLGELIAGGPPGDHRHVGREHPDARGQKAREVNESRWSSEPNQYMNTV
jgi:hypothetical protein